ncbi:hypothetical protein L6164_033803 [Bauhinia variegata]|uniref:Uncharacterized protein n=1 Tax=Bauhinia variegata TaxID=167791 RepID=A0ACB9KTA2_BAUVA|nr:hypothetical protein L6164_033803 [Bauhinia variegata]
MDMESSRRSFDRSREAGIKKPRLTDELERVPNSSIRQFPQRQVASGINTFASARFKTNDRESESNDSGRGGYQPQQPLHQELVTQYKTALAELTFNSKPIITNLTIIAGENVYAAKAIAATVCANIIEVPSEQKLPSLYLLDSIVKNIGRDYIKYFAARLPEVFCKAYRHVDSSVHQSMRHLFGTWKGVFPLPTLQMIEKELGFTPAANGSSSSSTLRSNSPSQRPPHSIHVNPKYLERQRLQQSNRTKGIANDMMGAIANSTEDAERPNRALGGGRPWADPSVNMHNIQQSHRDAFNDSVHEKSTGASNIGNEYNSDMSRNFGLGVGRTGGRISELGHDKSRYKAATAGVAETVADQRNGFSIKHGLFNHEGPKSMNLDANHQTAQGLTSIRSNVMSSSWKNSEEEEFMWDGMNSGLTDRGASNVPSSLSKDHWTADNENLAIEDHLPIPRHFGAKVDPETSTESLSTQKKQLPAFSHRPSLPWQLQEQHSIDGLDHRQVRSEDYASGLGDLPTSSSIRMGNPPLLTNATTGSAGMVGLQQFTARAGSLSGQSSLRQQSPSPLRHPNVAEQDHSQILKTSQISGNLQSKNFRDSSSAPPPNVQVSNIRRSQPKDPRGHLSSVASFPQRHQSAVSQQQQLGSFESEVSDKTEKHPQAEATLAAETSQQPTTSSLLAAVMKSGIFSNNSITSSVPNLSFLDTKNLPSQLGAQPPQPVGSSTSLISSGLEVASPSSLGPSPNDESSTLPNISQGKVGQPPRPPPQRPAPSFVSSASAQTSNVTHSTSNPISNLLSSLVAKGLISAKTRSVPAGMQTQLEDQSQNITTSNSLPVASIPGPAATPASSTGDDLDHDAKSSVAISQSTATEIRNLIGFEFKPDVIRELHPDVIRDLLDDLPHHCSACGLRLKHQEQFNRHLEWHATREGEQNGLIKASRGWYAKSSDWIGINEAEFPSECEHTDSLDINVKTRDNIEHDEMVPRDENQCLCVLCGEIFEDVYCQERDEWMFKGAAYMTISDSDGEMGSGPIIHAKCLSRSSISSVAEMEHD